jgi:hypothetical protein
MGQSSLREILIGFPSECDKRDYKTYSVRSACIGSIEAARRAGMNPAALAHSASIKIASASASGS